MAGAIAIWRKYQTKAFSSVVPLFATMHSSQKRSICIKEHLRLDEETYPKPWPYKEKGYKIRHTLYDRTLKRLHENSKLIVVEGNVASEKSEVARHIAESFGFLYIPEFQLEDVLIDRFGNDYRKFYHLIPKGYRIPDMNMFYKDPYADGTAVQRERIYRCRFDQYLNACAHILNTGQGVVLERTPHTDFVFANALREKNYIGPEYFMYYYYVRKRSLPNLHFWPHVVVYLDAPVDKCLENIRKEGNADKAAVIDRTYLETIHASYVDALKEFKKHSHLLAYDWTTPGNPENIVEDIEDLNLDWYLVHEGDQLKEWHGQKNEMQFTIMRQYVTDKRSAHAFSFMNLPQHECGELFISPRDTGRFLQIIHNEIIKTPYVYSAIRGNGDKRGWFSKIFSLNDSERWFEYYWKDTYLEDLVGVMEVIADPAMEAYYEDLPHSHH